AGKNAGCGGGSGGLLRGRSRHHEIHEIRPVAPLDRVHGVEHGKVSHGQNAELSRPPASGDRERYDLLVPIGDHIGGSRLMQGKQHDQAEHRPKKAAHPYLLKLLAAVPRGTIIGRQEREVMGEFREDSGNSPKSLKDAGHMTAFGDVRFNSESGELHRDGKTTRLTPKAAAVLAVLLEKAPGLVTKEEVLNPVRGGRAVGDEAITSCIQEMRRALDDDARNPRYIETRYRRGYRLMVPAIGLANRGRLVSMEAIAPEPVRLVGRAPELAELARCFQRARSGQRQLVFLTGEPGIGKSALA